jgi:hypothetical protein
VLRLSNLLLTYLFFLCWLSAQPPAPKTARPAPPTRDPHTPGYVQATELSDAALPSPTANGNFIVGPTHTPAPEMSRNEAVPQGTIYNFTIESKDSKLYPGIARDPGTFGTPDPNDPAKLVVTTSHPALYTRKVAVYVPKQYVPGTIVPFIVGADGPDPLLFAALDNLIAQHRVPVMIAISVGNGSGDAQVANAAWNTTPCRAATPTSLKRSCCPWWKNNITSS